MLIAPIYDSDGRRIGEASIDPTDFGGEVNKQLLHDVVVMHLANRRVGTVNTRGRADVAGSGKKLFRQKGTGNARAGSKRTNKRKGGGVAFARRNRDYSYDIPKKAVRKAVRMALLSKFQDGQVVIVEGLGVGGADAKPQTKAVARVLDAIPRPDADKPVVKSERSGRLGGRKRAELAVGPRPESKTIAKDKTLHRRSILIGLPGPDPVLYRSARNIEGVQIAPIAEFNTYDILKQRYLVLTREALEALQEKVRQPIMRRSQPYSIGGEGSQPFTIQLRYHSKDPDLVIREESLVVRPIEGKNVRISKDCSISVDLKDAMGRFSLPYTGLLCAADIRLPDWLELVTNPETVLVRYPNDEQRLDSTDAIASAGQDKPAPPRTSSQVKRPLVWIGENDQQEPAMSVGKWEVLQIRMGDPSKPTRVEGNAGDVPIEDIPESGLLTDWVVCSSNVMLQARSDESPAVSVTAIEEPDADPGAEPHRIYSARFELLIPRHGDSGVRKLDICPRETGLGRIDFLIYLRDSSQGSTGLREPYRTFFIRFPVFSDGYGPGARG